MKACPTFLLLLLLGACSISPACAQAPFQVVPIQPLDADTLTMPYPTFIWQAVPFIQGAQFKLEVFEVQTGQTKQAAVNANPVLYSHPFITTPVLVYPISAPALTGPHYAWRVVGTIPDNPAYTYSEVFEFFVVYAGDTEEPTDTLPLPEPTGLVLSQQMPTHPAGASSVLRLHYAERYRVPDPPYLNFTVTNSLGDTVATAANLQGVVLTGLNFVEVNFTGLVASGTLEYGQPYRLQALDAVGDEYWTRFVLIAPQP